MLIALSTHQERERSSITIPDIGHTNLFSLTTLKLLIAIVAFLQNNFNIGVFPDSLLFREGLAFPDYTVHNASIKVVRLSFQSTGLKL